MIRIRRRTLNPTHREEPLALRQSWNRWKDNRIGIFFRGLEFLIFGQPLQTLLQVRPRHDTHGDGSSYMKLANTYVHLSTGLTKNEKQLVVSPYLRERQLMSGNHYSPIRNLARIRKAKLFSFTIFVVPYQPYYYHFVLEWLPRIIHVNKQFPDVKFLTGDNSSFVPQFFELLGIELDESKLEIVKAEEFLIFESHLTLEQRVRVIRKHLLQEDNLSVENQKLFLTRKGHSRFDSSLEQQVLHYLPKRIEVCDPAELSVQEQIRKFSLTSELHGPHGGALTNMMFMPRKSKIIEYFSGYLKSTCYQDLAVACDLDYQSINVAKTT